MAQLNELAARLRELAPWLHPGGRDIAGLQRLPGGASQETWAFDLQLDAARSVPLILRRAPSGSARRAAGNATLAHRAALQTAVAPVPAVACLLRPEHGLGEGFVMQRLAGETLGRRIVAEPRLAAARARLARQCGRALARIHGVAADVLPPLRRAPPDEELAHYEVQYSGHGARLPVFELGLSWLKAHAPPPDTPLGLLHGDFRNGNLIVDANGLRAVLDCELAHLGDPMEDLGWLCVSRWRYGRPDLPVGGFGTREQLFAGCAECGGRVDAARVHYGEVLGTLKWGVICRWMAHSYLSGAERNAEPAAIGRRASEAEIDLLQLLAPRRRLCDRIADGRVGLATPARAAHLWQRTMDKLAVDQPAYASCRRALAEGAAR